MTVVRVRPSAFVAAVTLVAAAVVVIWVSPPAGAAPVARKSLSGSLFSWGINSSGQVGNGTVAPEGQFTPLQISLPGGVAATAVAVGQDDSLAIGADGHLYAWGGNYYGEVGDGTTSTRATPVQIKLPGGVRATAVAEGGDDSFAIGADGHLYAWGQNQIGQLGDGTRTDRHAPEQIRLPAGVSATAIATGVDDTLMIGSDGHLYTWGENNGGQLGDGTTTNRMTPEQIQLPGGAAPTSVAAAGYHSLAIGSDSNLYAWGSNTFGQLGDGTTTNRSTPEQIQLPGGGTPTAIAAGQYHSLAIGPDGSIFAWGSNGAGELGDGTVTSRPSPERITLPGNEPATSIAAGDGYTMAIGARGDLFGWGFSSDGEVGQGFGHSPLVPEQTSLPAGNTPFVLAPGSTTRHTLVIAGPASQAQPVPTVADLGASAPYNEFAFGASNRGKVTGSRAEGDVAYFDASFTNFYVGTYTGDKDALVVANNVAVNGQLGLQSGATGVYGGFLGSPVPSLVHGNPPFNFFQTSQQIMRNSDRWAEDPQTAGDTAVANGSLLYLTGKNSKLNVFDLATGQFGNAQTIFITVPIGSTVLINVPDFAPYNVAFQDIQYWNGSAYETGGQYNSDAVNHVRNSTMINMHNAQVLNIEHAQLAATVVAPRCDVTFNSGQLDGNLIAGQINGDFASDYDPPFGGGTGG